MRRSALAVLAVAALMQLPLWGQSERVITTVAGDGSAACPLYNGDNIPATAADLSATFGVAVDSARNLYIADTDNNRIRKVDAATGMITTVAGIGPSTCVGFGGYNGDNIPATSAELNAPPDVAVDSAGNLFIVDGHRIRKVNASTGIITTVAGTGSYGYNGDSIAATSAELYYPEGVALDSVGNLYITDTENQRVREVNASTGMITTVAGTGTAGYNGDNIPAVSAELNDPVRVAVDSSGNLYITDSGNYRVRVVNAGTGMITTVAGTGTWAYNGDNIPATSADLWYPFGISLDGAGNLYIADGSDGRIRKVNASTGIITTIAGTGTYGYNGDHILATTAELESPYDVAVDTAGNLYIADTNNYRIRKVFTTQVTGDFDGDGQSDLTVFRPSSGTWYVMPSGNPGTPIIQNWGTNGDIPVSGDYDGDGKTDVAVWRPLEGNWYIVPSSNPGTSTIQNWGTSGDIPVPGDYDGDGKTDLAIWRPSEGEWFIILSSNPDSPTAQQWGTNNDIPVPGDYDGDGKTDLAVWRPSTGQFFVIPSGNPSTPTVVQWGTNGDIPVAGDYDGDGKTDLAVWRPSTGQWFILPSSNPGSPVVEQWGQNGDVPVPGDYHLDGEYDIAVWRPSNGTWYVIPSSAPATPALTQWGTTGDIPSEQPIEH